MADVYQTEEGFLRDYRKLTQKYKNKAGKYLKDLLRLQRAENGIQGKLCMLRRPADTEKADGICCSFCGRPKDEAFRLIAAGHGDSAVYICDECARICGEIIDGEEAAEGEPSAD